MQADRQSSTIGWVDRTKSDFVPMLFVFFTGTFSPLWINKPSEPWDLVILLFYIKVLSRCCRCRCKKGSSADKPFSFPFPFILSSLLFNVSLPSFYLQFPLFSSFLSYDFPPFPLTFSSSLFSPPSLSLSPLPLR